MHSIVAGENITVDNTDPANPIVSSAPGVPAGMKGQFAGSAPPPGWLERDGSVLLRADFPALFAAIGTTYNTGGEASDEFRLPDDRGLFERNWDDGAGIDAGRAFGSIQQDQNKEHTHTGTALSAGNHSHSGSAASNGAHAHSTQIRNSGGSTSGPHVYSAGVGGSLINTASAGAHTHTLSINSGGAHEHTLSLASEGGAEVRVKNRASLAIIKF